MKNDEYIPSAAEAAGAKADLRKGKRRRTPDDARALNTVDRLPPHSPEAEQGVLGCVLLAPEEVMSQCEEACVRAEWFWDLRHQIIWAALAAMYAKPEAREAIEVLTVQQRLRDLGQLAEIGGIAYLAALPDTVPSAANLGFYLNIVKEKWTLRRMIRNCVDTVSRVYEHEGEIDELIDEHQKNALALSEESSGHAEVAVRELVLENIERFENDYHRGSAQITGLTTGLSYLDKVTGGLGGENGNYICVAARPGTGKTSIALDFVIHAALRHEWFSSITLDEMGKRDANFAKWREQGGDPLNPDSPMSPLGEDYIWAKDGSVIFQKHRGLPCAFFSLEMTGIRLVRRMLFQHSGSDLQRFRTGYANAADFVKLGDSAKKIAHAPIWVDDTSRLTVDMFKARCRRMVRQYGIKMFCLDYVQLMKSIRERHQRPERVSELEEISGEIRALSKELNVPIILLGQLNRDVEKGDRWRAPRSSDIKNCGAIEQDADVIMLLYRPKLGEEDMDQWDAQVRQVGGEEDWSQRLRRIDCLVDKNRDGMTGNCQLVFDGASTHFEDYGDWQKRHGLKERAAGEPKRLEEGERENFDDVQQDFPKE